MAGIAKGWKLDEENQEAEVITLSEKFRGTGLPNRGYFFLVWQNRVLPAEFQDGLN